MATMTVTTANTVFGNTAVKVQNLGSNVSIMSVKTAEGSLVYSLPIYPQSQVGNTDFVVAKTANQTIEATSAIVCTTKD